MAEESRFLRTLGTAQMPGTLGPSRTPAPLGIGPSIILMGDPVPAKVTQQRTGTLVLYIAPTPPAPQKKDGVEYRWSFDTNEGRVQYETALAKHLKDKGVISGERQLGSGGFSPFVKSVCGNQAAAFCERPKLPLRRPS